MYISRLNIVLFYHLSNNIMLKIHFILWNKIHFPPPATQLIIIHLAILKDLQRKYKNINYKTHILYFHIVVPYYNDMTYPQLFLFSAFPFYYLYTYLYQYISIFVCCVYI